MTGALQVYPETAEERNRWITAQRGPRAAVSATQPYAFLTEQERFADGSIGDVATIFLTNRECPWRCVMCDLWRNTVSLPVQEGEVPRQIVYALERLPAARQIKLYNSGSFFDQRAIPLADHAVIAGLLKGFERVIVECHPTLVGEGCLRFQNLIACDLEVAMGLETAHPEVLAKLNKLMTLEQYKAAAERLQRWGKGLRSFVLVQPPFLAPHEALTWARRSIDFAVACSATAVSLIPTRGGNGAMEALASAGQFVGPRIVTVEDAMDYGVARGSNRVFVDLWDIDRIASCDCCRDARRSRLERMNLSQEVEPRMSCGQCGGSS